MDLEEPECEVWEDTSLHVGTDLVLSSLLITITVRN